MAGDPLLGCRAVVVNWRDLDHSLAGGSEHYAWEFARALRSAGATVEFVTARDRGQARRGQRDGITIRRGGGPFGFYAYAAWRLLRDRRSIDVVIDPECGIPAFSPLFVKRSTAVVLVVHHVHQEQFTTYFPKPLAVLGQWLERVAMRRVYRGRRTVAVSASTEREMRAQLGWTGAVGLLENGTTIPEMDDGMAVGKLPDRVIVLGRLVPHKRVDLVLRAVAALAERRPALTLDVCGKGPERERLGQLAAELGIADRVRFHGFVDEATKQELLRRATVQVCASDVEGWGQVVIEAAAYGVPTVARDVPGLRDSIRDGHTGWLVPDGDSGEVQQRLTDQLSLVLTDLESPENRRLVFKSTQEWATRFSWARMHEQALHLVREELQRAHTQR